MNHFQLACVLAASLVSGSALATDPDPEQFRLDFRGVALGTPAADAARALDLVCRPSKLAEADEECSPRKGGQTFANVAANQVRIQMLNGRFDLVEIALPEKNWPGVIEALKAKWGPHTEATRIPTWMVNGARIYAFRTRQIMVVQMLSNEGMVDRATRAAAATAKAAADL